MAAKLRLLGVALGALSLIPAFGSTAASPAAVNPNPIKHIVVFMQENRSFDSYFGRLYVQGQPKSEPMPLSRSNPNPTGGAPIKVFHKRRYCESADLDHSWTGSHEEWNNGQMDGFTAAGVDDSDPTGKRAMGFYTKKDLPFYYWLFRTFAMGDRYFQSVLSQTFPNRFYLLAATSFGHIRNDFPAGPTEFSQKTIFEELDAKGITWKIYFSQVPFAYEFAYVRNHAPGNVVPIEQYYQDAANGTLPQVAYIDPIFVGQARVENDEHPPSNVQIGQSFARDVITALFSSPNWKSSALFLTYDEHGGFADHVPPPPAPLPDNIPPMLEAGDAPGAFDRYGFRVPAVVVSPYSKPHFVSHKVNDHTSILAFIEKRFGLPALTNRDAQANPMLEFFNFNHRSFAKPPKAPAAPINQAKLQSDQCNGANGT